MGYLKNQVSFYKNLWEDGKKGPAKEPKKDKGQNSKKLGLLRDQVLNLKEQLKQMKELNQKEIELLRGDLFGRLKGLEEQRQALKRVPSYSSKANENFNSRQTNKTTMKAFCSEKSFDSNIIQRLTNLIYEHEKVLKIDARIVGESCSKDKENRAPNLFN